MNFLHILSNLKKSLVFATLMTETQDASMKHTLIMTPLVGVFTSYCTLNDWSFAGDETEVMKPYIDLATYFGHDFLLMEHISYIKLVVGWCWICPKEDLGNLSKHIVILIILTFIDINTNWTVHHRWMLWILDNKTNNLASDWIDTSVDERHAYGKVSGDK